MRNDETESARVGLGQVGQTELGAKVIDLGTIVVNLGAQTRDLVFAVVERFFEVADIVYTLVVVSRQEETSD